MPKVLPEISYSVEGMQSLDPRTYKAGLEVQRIINLQRVATNLPNAFTDHGGVTKSHIPAINVPERE